MKLNTKSLPYLSPQDWRVLLAVETGTRNHLIVPTPLIVNLSHLPTGANAVNKSISTLAKEGLIAKVKNAKYDGYRLTYGGLDYLALHAHIKAGNMVGIGSRMGVGKESDIYLCAVPTEGDDGLDGTGTVITARTTRTTRTNATSLTARPQKQMQAILKLHRLGRISFRTAGTNRSYTRKGQHASWQYLSKLSAQKEHAAMRALYEAGFNVPMPIGWNRHALVMSLVPGVPLKDVKGEDFDDEILEPEKGETEDLEPRRRHERLTKRSQRIGRLYTALMETILELAGKGVIHGDFNEFNILIQGIGSSSTTQSDAKQIIPGLIPWIIDFPQITSMLHPSAEEYFDRDVQCVKTFFSRKFQFESDVVGPTFDQGMSRLKKNQMSGGRDLVQLDVLIEAAGFSKKMYKELNNYYSSKHEDVDNGGLGTLADEIADQSDPEAHNVPSGYSSDSEPETQLDAHDAMTGLTMHENELLDAEDVSTVTEARTESHPLTQESLEAQNRANGSELITHNRLQTFSISGAQRRGAPAAKRAAGWAL